MQNATPVMGQHQKHVKNLEADRRHGEEINGDQFLRMIVKECPPVLRGHFVSADHVFAGAALSDIDAKFEQFAMDAGCTPQGILPAHLADESSKLARNDRSSRLGAPHLQVQNSRKPARCQARTVSGLTMASAERQSRQRRERRSRTDDRRRLISGVLRRTFEARRFGGAGPGSRAPRRHANGGSKAELQGTS